MKHFDRRTFLKLSGVSAAMLVLAACDEIGADSVGSSTSSSADTSSSSSSPSSSASSSSKVQTLPVLRDGQKIMEQINDEMSRRKIENVHLKYSTGLEHAIQADAQMFVDYGKPEIPAETGDAMRGEYVDKMWQGLYEAGYESSSSGFMMMLKQYRIGVDLGYGDDGVYRLTKPYPRTADEFRLLVDDLVSEYGAQKDDLYYNVGITVVTLEDQTYWGAFVIPTGKDGV